MPLHRSSCPAPCLSHSFIHRLDLLPAYLAADRRVLRIQRDVDEVVQPREQTQLSMRGASPSRSPAEGSPELADPRDEAQADVRAG